MASPQGQKAPSEEELRELMYRTEQVRQQLSALEAQRDYIADVASEARRALSTVEHLGAAKPDEDVLVPLGAGVYLPARVKDAGRAVTSLGSGIHAEMTTAETATRLKARVENLDTAMSALQKDVARLTNELSRANAILETYVGGA